MAEQDPFISTADLEAILGVTLADPNSLIVKISLDAACQRVRSYLGQTVNKVIDDVEVHSGRGKLKIRLRQRPVRSITQIKDAGVVIASTNYTRRDAIITLQGQSWTPGNDNVEITYTHGWDIDEPSDFNVPTDIRLVALLAARRVYQAVGYTQTGSAGTLISETIGDYSYKLSEAGSQATSAAELLDAEKLVLDPYRVELVGDTPTQV